MLSRFTDCKSPPAAGQFKNSAWTLLPPPPSSASITDQHPPSTVARRQLNLCPSLPVRSKNWFPYAFCFFFFFRFGSFILLWFFFLLWIVIVWVLWFHFSWLGTLALWIFEFSIVHLLWIYFLLIHHWQLLVVSLRENLAVWFFSLHYPPPNYLRQVIDW